MAMNHVGQPDALREFNRSARELREAFGVVRIVARLVAIKLLTVEIGGVVNEKVAYALDRLTLRERRKSQSVAQRNGHAVNDRRSDLVPVIAREQHGHFMPHGHQGFGQRFDDICQAARLRVRQSFRGNEQDFHWASVETKTVTERAWFVKPPLQAISTGNFYPQRPDGA